MDFINFNKLHQTVLTQNISQKAFFITQVAQKKSRLLILSPHNSVAQALAKETESFLSLLKLPHVVCFYPQWESLPFEDHQEPFLMSFDRLQSLSQTEQKNVLIFSTLPAVVQNTLPKKVFIENSFSIFLEEECDQNILENKLICAGYIKQDYAFAPGTYALRGEILDISLPDKKKIRIRFDYDKIKKIQELDPLTQRSTETFFPSIDIFPASEVLLTEERKKDFFKILRQKALEQDLPLKAQEKIKHNIHLYPFMTKDIYQESCCLLDYYENYALIFNQRNACSFPKNSLNSEESSKAYFSFFELYSHRKDEITQKPFFDCIERQTAQQTFDVDLNFESISLKKSQLTEELKKLKEKNYTVLFCAQDEDQQEKISKEISEPVYIPSIQEGFFCHALFFAIFNEKLWFKKKASLKEQKIHTLFLQQDLQENDLVVHEMHGIGRYLGLARLKHEKTETDFAQILYANNDKLYIPVYRLNVLQKYIGVKENITLARLGTENFLRTKKRVEESLQKTAVDLLQLYAQKHASEGFIHSPPNQDYEAFVNTFEYTETADQERAIEEVFSDMTSGKVMDRMICGDVGFGKTEVAIRAAFRAAYDRKQVAIIAPTTLLAHQHEQSFKKRFKETAVIIESLSRFKTKKEQKIILEKLAQGSIDIIIGTHRLLSQDVKFSDLGLIVLDEEQRFGVEQKEALRHLRAHVHVLTLTATPIPRTLYLSFSHLKDISLITTPPLKRLSIQTQICFNTDATIKKGILFELNRKGQVFFLTNHISQMPEQKRRLERLIPQASIACIHAKCSAHELNKTMLDFYEKKIDILICSSIIESGLDLPNANTIFIDQAHRFGLAQLYQIRGRVGRSNVQAYCYLTIPEHLSDQALQRVHIIEQCSELGSGFQIASHDLEMRGAGEFLGTQQSGQMSEIGAEMYLQLLEKAIQDIQNKAPMREEKIEPEIKVPFSVFLPETYIPSETQRLQIYRNVAQCNSLEELTLQENLLLDQFGSLPVPAYNLLWLMRLKLLLKEHNILECIVSSTQINLKNTLRRHSIDLKANATINDVYSAVQMQLSSNFTN